MYEYEPTPEQRRNLLDYMNKEKQAEQAMALLHLLFNAGKSLDHLTDEELDALSDEEIERLCEDEEY